MCSVDSMQDPQSGQNQKINDAGLFSVPTTPTFKGGVHSLVWNLGLKTEETCRFNLLAMQAS